MPLRKNIPLALPLFLIALLPFLYGAVHPGPRLFYVVAASGLLLWQIALRARAGKRIAPDALPIVLAAVALVWAGLDLVPLPDSVLHALAPRTWELAIGNPAKAGLAPPVWHPIAVSPDPAIAGWATAAAHLAVFLIATRLLSGRRGARALAMTLLAVGCAIALLAIGQAFGGATRIYFIGLKREQFYGTFVNANHTASLLLVCCLCGLGLLLRERDFGRRMAWGVGSVVCAIGLLYSLSRGGILAFACALAAFTGGAIATQAAAPARARDEVGRFFRRHGVLLMLLGLAVFYLSWLGPKKIGRELGTLAALDLPSDYRTLVWKDSLGAVADWPMTGAGAGNFPQVFPAYRSFVTSVRTEMAESEYVQTAVENGVVGLALLVALGAVILGRFAFRYVDDPLRFSGAHLGFACALLGLAIHVAVDFPLRLPAMGAIAAALAGAIAGSLDRVRRKRRKKHHRDAPGPRPRARALAWAAAPLLALVATPSIVRPVPPAADVASTERAVLAMPADARAWVALAALARSRPDPAVDLGVVESTARALDPSDAGITRWVARAMIERGDFAGAAAALKDLLGRMPDDASTWPLRLDLADALLASGDAGDAEIAIAGVPESDPARARLHAEALAQQGDEHAPEAWIHAASLEKDRARAIDERREAVAIAATQASVLEPDEARARIDALAALADPGEVLRRLEELAASGALDTARIWNGKPYVELDDFSAGEPRLTRVDPKAPGEVIAHVLDAGAEKLELRYPAVTVTSDVWHAPRPFRSEDPALALELRVKGADRLGDQGCVEVEGHRVFGRLDPAPAAGGWRTIRVGGLAPEVGVPVRVDGWCFDTRGRGGPWWIDDVRLVLEN